ncbi:septation protein SepH [Nesterenkonia flava]|uniref:Septation protein SepH n=1 Tax=Nesterenkonia flava TaxID=469799 RepID=A0ABU1FTT0_9MICC|nr:septation protein SepH [Nesterenkonia flava]MDR5712074.1 septation protein SepH [Nesterenkonia flava]
MHHLRIVGVNTEGKAPQLILSDEAGTEYALPLDEALRRAVTRSQTEGRSAPEASSAQHSPREIQATLRHGATVEEVVEATGLSKEHVLRYAGPVIDERFYMTQRARDTQVAAASTAENHRLAFGDAPATLEAMVKVRLRAVGVDLSTVRWDSWRKENGLWTVICDFRLETSDAHTRTIGAQPPAEWSFDPAARQLRPANEWAEHLGSLPHSASGTASRRSGRRLTAVEEPFNVESPTRTRAPHAERAAQGVESGAVLENATAEGAGHDAEDLLDILRARRGQRLGTDTDGDDKLATLLTRDEQPHAAPRPLRPVDDGEHHTGPIPGLRIPGTAADDSDGAESPHTESGAAAEHDVAPKADPDSAGEGPSGTDAWGFSYADGADDDDSPVSEEAASGSAAEPSAGDGRPGSAPQREAEQPVSAPKKPRRSTSRRPSMPKWDDILFGSKD